MLPMEKAELVKFLKTNIDAFAWNAYDVSGIDPGLACHRLNINPKAVLRKQFSRRSSKDHAEAVKIKANKLKQARAIKEIFYPEWLANIVAVKNKNRKWRVCVDFTDFNKVRPKDPFLELTNWWTLRWDILG